MSGIPKVKMCKSPKAPQKLIEYESLSTNCTTVGSNNLHLVKKPQQIQQQQQQQMLAMSPAYSNPSPGYPASPYSSPAGLKSPSPSLGGKPPTPQPSSFPVMQIIHNLNNHNQLLARPINSGQQQNIIKLKPHLNILPKPSASPQPSPKPSVSPQIVIPTNQPTTIVPTAQPLLLNQMPVLTTPGVQFILRPQTKIPTQVQTATPQGLILQQSQPVLQIQPPRSQPLVRVLTNGMQIGAPTTTFVTQVSNNSNGTTSSNGTTQNTCQISKKKVGNLSNNNNKKKKQKLDLANIMKLSGIGDEDDIQFESDTSLSESSDHNSIHSQPNTPQPQINDPKKVGNIQLVQPPTTPLVQVLNQTYPSNVIPTSNPSPFNPFITPNFTINNGLMLQRSTGGFKLALGEDGRLILQHDPTLNQDLQSQLLLQSLFGLNHQLVLQPSLDQQVHSQTVQTIQQQSVQTIQQQTVQSQTIQTVQQQTVQPQSVQHSLQTIQQTIQPQIQAVQPQTVQQTVQQTIQHQTVNHHQPMQIVQPQNFHQNQLQHSIQNQIQSQIQSILQNQLNQNANLNLQNLPTNLPTNLSQNLQQNLSQNLQQNLTQNLQQNLSQNLQQNLSQNLQQNLSQNLQQNLSQNLQQNLSQNLQQTQTQNHHQIQSNSVQSQTSIQHQPNVTSQQIQTQPILKVQPFQKSQPPVQTVHPQPINSTTNNSTTNDHHQQSQQQPTSYVVNLTPDQLEQLKRCGQVTVNGQTIFMQRSAAGNKSNVSEQFVGGGGGVNNDHGGGNNVVKGQVKLSPKSKPIKKVQSKSAAGKLMGSQSVEINKEKGNHQVKDVVKSGAVQMSPPVVKNVAVQNHTVQVQPQQQQIQTILQKQQPAALVQPSVVQSPNLTPNQINTTQHQPQKTIITSKNQQKIQPNPTLIQPVQQQSNNLNNTTENNNTTSSSSDVDHLLGQIIEESSSSAASTSPPVVVPISTASQTITIPLPPPPPQTNINPSQGVGGAVVRQRPPQRVHTIQLTPQKQQHLKSIQLQIQTLSARLTPGDTEMHNALNVLFQEQQKILATGKLLPPDKVYYHNNQLTIVNPQPLPSQKVESVGSHHHGGGGSGGGNQSQGGGTETNARNGAGGGGGVRNVNSENISSQQVVTPQNIISNNNSSKISINPVSNNNNNNVTSSTISTTIINGVSPSSIAQQQQQHHHNQQHQQSVQTSSSASKSMSKSGVINVTYQQSVQNIVKVEKTEAQLNQERRQKAAEQLEKQFSLDQTSVQKPDIRRPFSNKTDACKRLMDYHCFSQPPICAKDLDTADECFELTAKHYLNKFSKMMDKYQCLRIKESMREVPTSELMMLDRLFVMEEQQSLMKLRQDMQDNPPTLSQLVPPSIEVTPPSQEDSTHEEYDEWACIQKELSSLQPQQQQSTPNNQETKDNLKRNREKHENDSMRLECLKKFRVEKKRSVSPSNYQQQSDQNQHFQQNQVINSSHQFSVQQQHFTTTQNGRQQRSVQQFSSVVQHHHHVSHHHTIHHHHGHQVMFQQQQQQNQSNLVVGGVVGAGGNNVFSEKVFNGGSSTGSTRSTSSTNSSLGGGPPSGTDNIIDEQVQSAIDSILNLQQSSLDLDDVNSILS